MNDLIYVAPPPQPARIDLDEIIYERIAFKYFGRSFFDDPRNFRICECFPDRRQSRQRVHNVADAAEFYNKEPH